MGGIIMNENLDLTKILEGCPKGTEFYSSIFGEVSLESISTSDKYPIGIQAYNNFSNIPVCIYYTKDGRYSCAYDGECTLFPSRTQRDWAKFERFWDKPKVEKFDVNTLQPFDKVLVRNHPNDPWRATIFGYIIEYPDKTIDCAGFWWKCCIPYNDETKHLVGTNNDCPKYYKWWEE